MGARASDWKCCAIHVTDCGLDVFIKSSMHDGKLKINLWNGKVSHDTVAVHIQHLVILRRCKILWCLFGVAICPAVKSVCANGIFLDALVKFSGSLPLCCVVRFGHVLQGAFIATDEGALYVCVPFVGDGWVSK